MSYEDYESPLRRGSDRYDNYMPGPRRRTYRDYDIEDRPHRPAYREDDRPRQDRNYMRDEIDKRPIRAREPCRGRREAVAGPPPPRRGGGGRSRTQQDGSTSKPSNILGVFGLSTHTTERDLYDIFSDYGAVSDIQLVYDSLTGRSRGFAFVYYELQNSARDAKASFDKGLEIAGRLVRVDYSITSSAHPPTPGIYMGKFRRPIVDEDDYRRGARPVSRKGMYGVDGPGRRYKREEYPQIRRPPPGPYSRRPVYDDDPPSRRGFSGMPPHRSRDRYQPPPVRRRRTESSSRSRSPPPIYRGQRGGAGVKTVANREDKQQQTSATFNGRSRSAHLFASLSPGDQPKLLEQSWADDQA